MVTVRRVGLDRQSLVQHQDHPVVLLFVIHFDRYVVHRDCRGVIRIGNRFQNLDRLLRVARGRVKLGQSKVGTQLVGVGCQQRFDGRNEFLVAAQSFEDDHAVDQESGVFRSFGTLLREKGCSLFVGCRRTRLVPLSGKFVAEVEKSGSEGTLDTRLVGHQFGRFVETCHGLLVLSGLPLADGEQVPGPAEVRMLLQHLERLLHQLFHLEPAGTER